MGRRRPVAVLGLLLLLMVAAGWWAFGRSGLARRHDVAAWRAVYRAFPVFPGAAKHAERSYEFRGDGAGTGRYGLTVTYRLPPGAAPVEVVEFFRRHFPPGWREATDETCARLAARMPPAPRPVATQPSGAPVPTTSPSSAGAPLMLIRQAGELTVFAPQGDGADGGAFKGVTFKISTGPARYLTLDNPTFGCQPPSPPD